MKILIHSSLAAILVVLFTQNIAVASNQYGFGQRIYQFHKKLAENGNTLSQYKLATMYELGLGTEPDIEQAIRWYTISSKNGHASASDRLTYLQIKNEGYSTDKYGDWLDKLRAQAQNNDAESLFLLGQLYQQGIAVDKNPNQAILLLKKAGTLGMIEADLQVEIIEREQASRKKRGINRTETSSAPARDTKSRLAEESSREEKRLRYQAAMNKIKLEQKLLDDQQIWAESQ